ncbi:MAG: hypothetical protein JKY37_29110, partial [Nannocystaceae bacterium]|nr:hypothetical protein [Nannocystaceae bacterium]
MGCDASEAPAGIETSGIDDAGPLEFRCASGDIPGIGGLNAVTINGSASIEGRYGAFDLFSNGDVAVAGTATVHGGIYSAGATVELFDTATVTGEFSSSGVTIPNWIPEAEVAYIARYQRNRDLWRTRYGRDPTYDNNSRFRLYNGDRIDVPSGLYYFNSLSVTGRSRMRVTGTVYMVVDGPITFSGRSSLEVQDAGRLLIIGTSGDAIRISGGSNVTARIYAPDAPVVISGTDTHFTGGVVGGTLQMSGSSTMEVRRPKTQVRTQRSNRAPRGNRGGPVR